MTNYSSHKHLPIATNPFVPLQGKIDNPLLVFGRDAQIQRLFELLNSGSSIALLGESAIGKSSILEAVCQQAPTKLKQARKPVYLDLQAVKQENDFYSYLCTEIGITVCRGVPLSRALSQFNSKLLLIFDEIDKMNWQGFNNQIAGQLRALAEGNDAPLRLIVATTSLENLFPPQATIGMTSYFTGIFAEEKVELWNEETSLAFINDRLAENPVSFTPEELQYIINHSAGHPQKMMSLCHEIYEIHLKSTD